MGLHASGDTCGMNLMFGALKAIKTIELYFDNCLDFMSSLAKTVKRRIWCRPKFVIFMY